MILGCVLSCCFYNNGVCLKETIIEQHFNKAIRKIYPDTIIQKSFGSEIDKDLGLTQSKINTDGIINFNTGNWILQECKRDIGIHSVDVPRAFLQSMCYLVRYLKNFPAPVKVDTFNGILLDSARFVCFIPRQEVLNYLPEFTNIYNKYYGVRPSQAYIVPELNEWGISHFKQVRKHLGNLWDFNFRFDLFIKDIYDNKYLG